jgi:hypothetical protein
MKKLIEPESDLFEDFFRDCSIVMSAPNVVFLVGEHAVLRGIPSVVQAMPTRVYVGIKQRERLERWLTSKTLDSNGILREAQVREDPNLVGIRHLKSFAEVYYRTRTAILPRILDQIDHLAIKVLSDTTPGSGANWSGAFSSALAGCVHFGILKNMLNPHVIHIDLTSWRDGCNWETSDRFRDINLLAFFLESAFHGGRASGYGNVVSLLGPSTPVVYRTRRRFQDRRPYINVYRSVNAPLDPSLGTPQVISHLEDIASSVQLTTLSSDWLHLVYIAVIDTLRRKEIGTAGAISKLLDELLCDLRIAGTEVPGDLGLVDLDFFLQPDEIWFALDYNILAFIHFFNLFLREGNMESLSKAIRYMNSVSSVLLSFGLGWKEFADISTRLLAAPGIDQNNTAVKLSGGGMAGVCTLVSKELDHDRLAGILGESDCILYSSDLSLHIDGLRLHKLGGEYL